MNPDRSSLVTSKDSSVQDRNKPEQKDHRDKWERHIRQEAGRISLQAGTGEATAPRAVPLAACGRTAEAFRGLRGARHGLVQHRSRCSLRGLVAEHHPEAC